ncbi:glycosyltransferase family 87 protein [Streptomyces sp. TRM64462]|uniref:glycosyltransferase family 87 protein n=1 Tax=Streptomyces sp. TRM64462 TaxID=2741726 RepID=UPI002815BDA0|nr:glycosyltransferase family 87 protein [Streptomyces sp. TRM64462]
MPKIRTVLAAALLAALVVTLVLTVRFDGYYTDPATLSWWYGGSWALFGAAVWALRGVPARQGVALVLAGAAAVAATGLVAPPRTSTDAYRYAWDGRVQAAGIPPYDHAPADPALARLRDPWLFPEGAAACTGPDRTRIAPAPADGDGDGDGTVRCTRLNRPSVHTIYPPVAEAYFLGVHALSPDGARLKPFQVGGALLSLGVTGVLLLVLRRRPGTPWTAALWAWCPAVPVEAVNNAHVDVLGVLFAVAGLALVARRRRLSGGVLLGAAVATKLMPAVVLPGALAGVRRPRDAAAVLVPAAGVTALAYLPYALLSRDSVFGYLGGYVEEEGYGDAAARDRYALLRLVLPDDWTVPALVAVTAVVCGYVLWRGDPERPWSAALTVTGTAFLLLTPGYSWYALLLVALVALDGRWEWLLVAVAGAARYVTARAFEERDVVGTTVYAAAALAVLAGWLLRRRRSRRRRRAPAGEATGGTTAPGARRSAAAPTRSSAG